MNDTYDITYTCTMPSWRTENNELRHWHATLDLVTKNPATGEFDDRTAVAGLSLVLTRGGCEELDGESADMATFCCLYSDGGPLSDEPSDRWEEATAWGEGLVVVDRLHVGRKYRGVGLGPWLLMEALFELSRGYRVVALTPAAYEVEDKQERAAFNRRLVLMYKRLGFVSYGKDNVYVAFPFEGKLDRARAKVRKRVSAVADIG